jgi:hypothetical protein
MTFFSAMARCGAGAKWVGKYRNVVERFFNGFLRE